jgi:hypothetical protein
MRQVDDLGETALIGRREIGDIDAVLRAAQRRHQRDKQHGRAIVPRIQVARIANLPENRHQSPHGNLPNREVSERIASYPLRNKLLSKRRHILICDSLASLRSPAGALGEADQREPRHSRREAAFLFERQVSGAVNSG